MPNPWKQNSRDVQSHQNTNMRFDVIYEMPDVNILKSLLEAAIKKSGSIIEQPILVENIEYILMVQIDKNFPNPVWSMYKNDPTEQRNLFTEQYPANELNFLLEIILMSANPVKVSTTSIPDELRIKDPEPEPEPEKNQNAKDIDKSWNFENSTQLASDPYNNQQQFTQQQQMPYTPAPGYYPPPPPQPYVQNAGYYPPPMPQAMPPQMPYQPAPAYYAPPQPHMTQPPMPFSTSGTYESYSESKALDYSLIEKKSKELSVEDLILKSQLLSQDSINAVLKIQELLKDGVIDENKAVIILQKHHSKGNLIEQYLNDTKPINTSSTNINDKTSSSQKSTTNPNGFSPDLQACFDLLIKASAISQDMLDNAVAVRKKHGGSVVQILQAAKQLDAITFECAKACIPLMKEGLMKIEQCVKVVNYANRMKVSFDTALEELNIINPRKVRKDLNL